MARLSVIILNWNGKQHLDGCLESLALQSFRDFETVLFDNGSTDGSAEYVRERFPWVRLVAVPQNLGFAGGNNRAFDECQGEFIVTLNNDTKVSPDFLSELVAAAEADPKIGMVAAKMLNFYQPGRIDSAGVKVAANGMGYNVGVGETDVGQYDTPTEVFGPCAGAALYRRAMLDEVGFFDDDFFAYYEDLDLAWRGRLAGWRAVSAPGAVVLHVHSATSGKMSPFTVYHVHRNKWFVLVKNWPASLLGRHLFRILCFDLGALALAVLRHRAGAALRARWDVVRSLPLLLQKRKEVAALRRLTPPELAALLQPANSAVATFARKARE
ncbi:glycosyltransferase family 2 protein [Geomesophilobacter sediminis]|uniref:Glycosyltransferase family 2 protein n=1 Tax=Geomesophilobacter sediminis TaxID=2798584 RepID=A0A8J7M1N8_9BACT|nr:glycosyltransferase family 2 protein [Geomesophilobacter sediminis]MBJ6727035.1 glycosyltransferase family 2 protein [Geomesophilobacter sediminis]